MDGTPVKDLLATAESALRDFNARYQEAEAAAKRMLDAFRDLAESVDPGESS
jgi:hypothetical protein